MLLQVVRYICQQEVHTEKYFAKVLNTAWGHRQRTWFKAKDKVLLDTDLLPANNIFIVSYLFFSFKKPAKIILCKRTNFEIMKIYRVKNPFKFLVHTQEQGQLLQFLKLIALIVWIHTPFLFHPCRGFFVTRHSLHSLKWTKT